MAACLSDHAWALEEIVTMADNYLPKPGKRVPYKTRSLLQNQVAKMGLISRAIDKVVDPLPTWAKGILGLLVVIGFIYGIIHDGFRFLLRVIFSPDL
jgi:hypothetical protein